MQSKGLLITLEGGEGGGKTTQILKLKQRCVAAGKDVIALREPGGTAISEQIREMVLTEKHNGVIGETTEVLLFQSARAQIYHEVVLPALAAGKIVLIDRSRDSSVVYQGMVRNFGKDLIEQLNDVSTQKTYPDITFLLDVPVEIGLQRKNETGENNRFEMENANFHEQVRQAYLTLAKENSHNRWQIIDCTQSVEAVSDQLWQQLQNKLA